MNLTRAAIRNSQFVVILLLIAIILSVRSFLTMPRSEDPQLTLPIYNVIAVYPGTDPEDIETFIVDPIEEAIEEIDDIDRIETFIFDGVVRISIEAAYDIDSEEKFDEIVREVNTIKPNLPEGIVRFDVEQIKPEDRVNFLIIAVTGDGINYAELERVGEELEKRVEVVDGVKKADVEAYPEQEVQISLDYERMSAVNVSLNQVIGILQSNNANVPGGEVSAGGKTFSIKSTGAYENLQELRSTIVSARDNQVVYLSDIAEVYVRPEDQRWRARFNQQKSIYVSLKLSRGYNIIEVDKKVREVITAYQDELPASITLNTAFEQAPAVQGRINDFFINLLQGIVLVGVVILLVLGWRAAIIIITLIPVCIMLSLAIMNGSGFGLQQISIASLVLALGLLVDNGIVVIENINRFISSGFSKQEASVKGPSEVGQAIVSSTVTTLLSFFPLTQLGGGPGLFLMSLPLTVILTLVISLILALSFSPIMANWVMSRHKGKSSWSDRAFRWLAEDAYAPVLRGALRWRWLVALAAIVLTVFSIRLFPSIGVSFFPTADKPVLLIDVEAPKGSSLEYTDAVVRDIETILDTMSYVKNYSANAGNGNPQMYYNRFPFSSQKNRGQLLLNFDSWDQELFYRNIGELRRIFQSYPDAEVTMEELKNGAPVNAPIEIRIIGSDLDSLKRLAGSVEKILTATPDVINIVNPLERNSIQLNFQLDKDKAGLLNVSQLDFDRTVRASLNGLIIDEIKLQDDEDYRLVVRMPFDESPAIEDFHKVYVTNRLGAAVPLHHIAKITFAPGLPEFYHYDTERYIGVTGSVTDLDKTIARTTEIIEELDKMNWPAGYRYMVGGEYEEQQSTFGSLAIILLLAQVAIFAVLVLQFRSLRQPFIVFAAIPLAISGSFIALYLTGWPFSFFAFVGLISLIGIVVNNSIILVDYINQLRRDGVEMSEAILQGATLRLKPILLTTITTILGLIPLTLQATNQWSPLCWTIIGGMLSSTLLTLFIVPILYRWWAEREMATQLPE